jgi:hypothetical protein
MNRKTRKTSSVVLESTRGLFWGKGKGVLSGSPGALWSLSVRGPLRPPLDLFHFVLASGHSKTLAY